MAQNQLFKRLAGNIEWLISIDRMTEEKRMMGMALGVLTEEDAKHMRFFVYVFHRGERSGAGPVGCAGCLMEVFREAGMPPGSACTMVVLDSDLKDSWDAFLKEIDTPDAASTLH